MTLYKLIDILETYHEGYITNISIRDNKNNSIRKGDYAYYTQSIPYDEASLKVVEFYFDEENEENTLFVTVK